MNERLQWFRDRIGKRVFRNKICNCDRFSEIDIEGIVIPNDYNATYMHDTEACSDGFLRYFDTREEVTEYEMQLKLKEI